ncbi:MAG: DUF4097 domain-containing protein [Clostridia bacterium]|nr:DUF4097 domain-containing protein [Clostridia bacterium]
MSTSEERLLILKMLEEGKISSEEAARLIDALGGSQKQSSGENTTRQQQQQQQQQQRQTSFQEEVTKLRDKVHEWKKDFKSNYNQKDFDRMVEDFSTKAEKLGKNVANTTFGIVDKVVDFVGSFVDTNAFNFFGNYPTIEKSFEVVAVEGMELNVEGVNNYIVVKKHSDNKILIKSKIKSPAKDAESILTFSDEGNTITVKPAKQMNFSISVSHEVFLPAVKFSKIRLESTNGRIYAEDSISGIFEAITKNSHIELMGVNSDKINVSTKNAKIQVNYVMGKDIDINTNNSVIDIKHIKAQNIKAVTMNSKILVENAQNFENCEEMNIFLKTSNGGIKVNMNDMENRGYKVKAQTTNGGINILIPEMTYHNVNKQGIGGSSAEAESIGYMNYSQKVNINAETNNGYIEVVK